MDPESAKPNEVFHIPETRDYLPPRTDAPAVLDDDYRKSLRPADRPETSAADTLTVLCESASWSADIPTTYSNMLRAMKQIFRADYAGFLFIASDGASLSRWTIDGTVDAPDYEAAGTAPAVVRRIHGVIEDGRPYVLDLLHPEEGSLTPSSVVADGFKQTLLIPLVSSGASSGLCALAYKRTIDLVDQDLSFASLAGRVLGTMVQRIKATRDSRELAVLEERQRLSAEIHDNVSHGIGALSVSAGSILASFDEGDMEAVRAGMARFEELCGKVMHQFRDEMLNLRVPLDRTEELVPGIESCLKNFERQWGIRTEFILDSANQPPSVNLAVSLQLMRILNECMSNIARHAHATSVVVVLEESPNAITMQVGDDGCGFNLSEVPMERMGLRIMASRAADVGGQLTIESCSAGTTVTARIPRFERM